MAYFRGDVYIWNDRSRFHFWCADGYDEWDDSVWACHTEEPFQRRDDRIHASGTSVPAEEIDEFVVMRMAELILDGEIQTVIDRVLETNWNPGSDVLRTNAGKLKEVLGKIHLDPPNSHFEDL